jgi:hypothetical protein
MSTPSRQDQPVENRKSKIENFHLLALVLWVVAMAVILGHVWLKPNSNTLYKVFRNGGARWLASENLYPKVDEYIYSPFAAALFAPLALLPDRVAGIVWRVVSLAAYAGAFAAWMRNARAVSVDRMVSVEREALAWILLLPLSLGDFFNGQANPLVIGLLMLAVLECRRERWMIAAVCVGVAAYFKVYPLAMGLLLGVLHPRKFPWRLALALAGIFVLSLVLQRPAYAWRQYGNWVGTLRQDPRRTLNYFGTYRDFWLLLRVLRVPVSVQGWALLQAVSGAAVAVYLHLARRRGAGPEKLDFLLMALGTCWMLLFGPATESSTYVLLAPALALAWVRWSGEAEGREFLKSAAGCYALLLASQMLSSWGHQYQNAYTHLAQPAGTMILAAAVTAYGWKAIPRMQTEAELADKAAVE